MIVGLYHEAIKIYLKVRVYYFKVRVLNESNNRESQQKSNNLNHYPRTRNEAQNSNKTK